MIGIYFLYYTGLLPFVPLPPYIDTFNITILEEDKYIQLFVGATKQQFKKVVEVVLRGVIRGLNWIIKGRLSLLLLLWWWRANEVGRMK